MIPILYRGDCFTYTTTIRLHRNFTSQTVPTNDTIVDFNTWKIILKVLEILKTGMI